MRKDPLALGIRAGHLGCGVGTSLKSEKETGTGEGPCLLGDLGCRVNSEIQSIVRVGTRSQSESRVEIRVRVRQARAG